MQRRLPSRFPSRLKALAATLALVLATTLLLPGTGYAQAANTNMSDLQHGAVVAFDAVVLRPLGFVALVTGALFIIPVAALTWPGGRGTLDDAVERFVTDPAKDLFEKPLGEV